MVTTLAPVKSQIVLDERSEEHTSELQSQSNVVCRLLLENKKRRRWRSFEPGRPADCATGSDNDPPAFPGLRTDSAILFPACLDLLTALCARLSAFQGAMD